MEWDGLLQVRVEQLLNAFVCGESDSQGFYRMLDDAVDRAELFDSGNRHVHWVRQLGGFDDFYSLRFICFVCLVLLGRFWLALRSLGLDASIN